MWPALTCCPPNFLRPRRLLSESRPFLVLPPAFLCAMVVASSSGRGSGADDAGDLDVGVRLAMRALPQVVLAAAELHDDLLVALAVRLHGGRDLAARDEWRADLDIGALPHEQHLVELDGAARFGG